MSEFGIPMNKVIIIGGGYLGADLARKLDTVADVTLIEQRGHFVHASSNIRALLDPAICEKSLIPYDKLLKRGQVIRGKAIELDKNRVKLESGVDITGDLIVIATGSHYALPFKPNSNNIQEFKETIVHWHQKILNAQHIGIIGTGPVGIELAGEIKYALPDKPVTLISKNPTPLPQYPTSFGQKLLQQLEQLGVDIRLGKTVTPVSTTSPYEGSMTLADGEVIASDLVFPVLGARAHNELTQSLPGITHSNANRVTTDPWLRPSSLTNIFIGGDIADTGDAMTITTTIRHSSFLYKTLKAVLSGKTIESLSHYKPWPVVPLVVPLGPEKGHTILPLGNGLIVGNCFTSAIKGKDLFIPRYCRLFNQV